MRTLRPVLAALALLGALLGLLAYAGRRSSPSTPARRAPLWRRAANRRPQQLPRPPLLVPALVSLAVLCALAYGGWRVVGLVDSGSATAVSVRAPSIALPTPTLASFPTPLPPPPTSPPPAEVEAPPAEPTDEPPPAQVQSQPSSAPPVAPTNPPVSNASPPPVVNNAPPPAETSGVDAAYTAAVLARINRERASRGLSTVSIDGALQSAAESYAALLTQLHTLSHDANGLDLSTRLTTAGYSGSVMGEILWYGGGIFAPDETVDAWLASPGHHDIMLDPHFTAAGAACYVYIAGSDYETRCVVDLGG